MSLPQRPYVFTPNTLCLHPLLHITAALLPFPLRHQPPFLDYFINQTLVGYNTVTIQPGFNMLSVNFKDINNTEGIDLQTLFKGNGDKTTPFKAGSVTDADTIMIYVNDGVNDPDYVNYYLYWADKGGDKTKFYYWLNAQGSGICDRKLKNGDALWFQRKGTTPVELSVSGEVELAPVKEFTIQKGFNMIGSYFPAGWFINDAPYDTTYWQNCGAKAGSVTDADTIMVYVNNGKDTPDYENYYLYWADKGGDKTKFYKWLSAKGSAIAEKVVDAGQGMWYQHKGNGYTLKIQNQFSK